ncbi:MAG: hypothetical protein WC655_04210 [Candidatus Hydrogenedentales bacterium]|jgi:hypothetical protein
MTKRKLTGVVKIVLALMLGFIAYQAIVVVWNRWVFQRTEKVAGLSRQGVNTYLDMPQSFNHVRESATDTNADGKVDTWNVDAREDMNFPLHYTMLDTNRDGEPDIYHARLWNDAILVSTLDDDNDGKPDEFVMEMCLPNGHGARYTYKDYDLDGRWDETAVSSPGRPGQSRVFFEDRLLIVSAHEKRIGNSEHIVWIEHPDKGDIRLISKDGKWTVHPDQTINTELVDSNYDGDSQ